MTTPVLVLKKIETKYDTFYSYSKAETIINESDTDYVIESGKDSAWIIDSVIELGHPRKGLINIQNIDGVIDVI